MAEKSLIPKVKTWRHGFQLLGAAAPVAVRKFLAERKVWILDKVAPLRCKLGDHHWTDTFEFDPKSGEPVKDKPGRGFRMCDRPNCKALAGKLEIYETVDHVEVWDYVVMARKKCKYCHGRGYSTLVQVEGGKAKRPCTCLVLFPMFLHRDKFPANTPRINGHVVDGITYDELRNIRGKQ